MDAGKARRFIRTIFFCAIGIAVLGVGIWLVQPDGIYDGPIRCGNFPLDMRPGDLCKDLDEHPPVTYTFEQEAAMQRIDPPGDEVRGWFLIVLGPLLAAGAIMSRNDERV